jgi:hypothetical protein
MGIFQSCLGGKSSPPTAVPLSKKTPSGETLDSIRGKAKVHYQKRGELLAASQAAWKAGDKGKAHDLSVKGKAEGAKAIALDEKAVAFVLGPQASNKSGQIDLHGLHVTEAEAAVEDFLALHAKKKEFSQLLIITGAGHHSKHHDHPVIRPAIESLLTKKGYHWKEVHKRGALLIETKGRRALDIHVGDGHFDKHIKSNRV